MTMPHTKLVRRAHINRLRKKKGLPPLPPAIDPVVKIKVPRG
jgi:hypothetical protein